jgi:ribosomal protein S27AE
MKTMNANLETKEKTECSWSCPECGGTTYYVTDALRRVCGACGLEDETATDMYVSQPMKDTDARKRVQSSPVYDGKFITLIKGGV